MSEWEQWLDKLAAEHPAVDFELLIDPSAEAPCPLELWQQEQYQAWAAAGFDRPAWTLSQVCWASPN
jgi:hypothetical protein